MGSTAATLVLFGFLVPALVVFVVGYRYALRTWLIPRLGPELPVATVVGRPAPAARIPFDHRVHATIIGVAFASVFTMGLIAVALVAMVIVSAIAGA